MGQHSPGDWRHAQCLVPGPHREAVAFGDALEHRAVVLLHGADDLEWRSCDEVVHGRVAPHPVLQREVAELTRASFKLLAGHVVDHGAEAGHLRSHSCSQVAGQRCGARSC